jgi:uncharacterized protein YkwD
MIQSCKWAVLVWLLALGTLRAESIEKAEDVFKSEKLIEVEQLLIEATNAERARFGLPALEVDFNLMSTSRRHTAWMANSGAFRHGSYPVAENIALGQESVSEAIRSWMNSSGHRANILGSRYSKIGVAAYQGGNGKIYWTQQFN